MPAEGGMVLVVFEWISQEAIASAHSNPVVLEHWESLKKVRSHEIPGNVAEFQQMFSQFGSV